HAVRRLHPADLAWKQPPYEYEPVKLPIDILAGTDRLRLLVDAGAEWREFEDWFTGNERIFTKLHHKYRLY
ncbi:DUF1343 domain-containing protein, partial [bacterium]|nr:DUF1343 domain-containing protein [candidate division CSSED10-310 bacterium]